MDKQLIVHARSVSILMGWIWRVGMGMKEEMCLAVIVEEGKELQDTGEMAAQLCVSDEHSLGC